MIGDPAIQIELAARLLVAAVLGAVIGIERELHEHPAGMRTHMLVSVGAATFTVLSIFAFTTEGSDPGRIAAPVVSGIGFLGAGAIIKYGATVRGLTTAASLWAVAAVGMAAGAGAWGVAAVATVIVVVSLWPLNIVADRFIGRDQRRMRVRLSVAGTKSLGRLFEGISKYQASIRQLASERTPDGRHQVELEIRADSVAAATSIMANLESIEGVELAATVLLED